MRATCTRSSCARPSPPHNKRQFLQGTTTARLRKTTSRTKLQAMQDVRTPRLTVRRTRPRKGSRVDHAWADPRGAVDYPLDLILLWFKG